MSAMGVPLGRWARHSLEQWMPARMMRSQAAAGRCYRSGLQDQNLVQLGLDRWTRTTLELAVAEP